jgi:hypothetical protein
MTQLLEAQPHEPAEQESAPDAPEWALAEDYIHERINEAPQDDPERAAHIELWMGEYEKIDSDVTEDRITIWNYGRAQASALKDQAEQDRLVDEEWAQIGLARAENAQSDGDTGISKQDREEMDAHWNAITGGFWDDDEPDPTRPEYLNHNLVDKWEREAEAAATMESGPE